MNSLIQQDLQSNLKTGEYIVIHKVLPKIKINRLIHLADHKLNNEESRPIYIHQEESLGKDVKTRYRSAGVQVILQHAAPWLNLLIGPEWLILSNKVLLRRTWPLSEHQSRSLGHNASNLTWHQDSNPRHNDCPMLVMMVVLQNHSGVSRPGLSILKTPIHEFQGVYGYEGGRVDEFERKIKEDYGQLEIGTPELNAGDLLIFNGLTFHRTYAHQAMKEHRDALLVRVVQPKHQQNFPKGIHWTIHSKELLQ